MIKYAVTFAMAGALAMFAPSKPASVAGSWQVDAHHSDAKITTDGTTDFGKQKIDIVLGFGRVNGVVKVDEADLSKSDVHLHIYPATSMQPVLGEDGQFKTKWLMDPANQTLVCFHSKQVTKTADGRLQATGELRLVRVDRNVQVDPSEAYSGPVYGPPILHTVSRQATFAFDLPGDSKTQSGALVMAGSTAMTNEMFPQLVKAVVNTYWPPLVQDANCVAPTNGGSEDYRGGMCTGKVLQAPALPLGPYSGAREDYPGPGDYNAVSGTHLSIVVHVHLLPAGSAGSVATGD
ncbi:MAG: YceI family protein [Candidatus Korobacteraceae bacterium]